MLKEYLKQCCLIIAPEGNAESSGYTALHKTTAELDVAKRVFSMDENILVEWKRYGYESYPGNTSDKRIFWKDAFSRMYSEGFRKVILLTNSPVRMEPRYLEEAFLSLRILEVCMGPEKQGGLYLVGFNSFRPDILDSSLLDENLSWKSFQKACGAVKAAMYKSPLL